MANPNCVAKYSQRSMQLLDTFASSDSASAAARAQEWKGEGFIVRLSSYKIGPKKSPIVMHKASKYSK